MSSDRLKKEFEAYANDRARLVTTDCHSGKYKQKETRIAWHAYQAGHAVNAELLDALRQIELAFFDSPAHGALACKMAGIATESIKKARAE